MRKSAPRVRRVPGLLCLALSLFFLQPSSASAVAPGPGFNAVVNSAGAGVEYLKLYGFTRDGAALVFETSLFRSPKAGQPAALWRGVVVMDVRTGLSQHFILAKIEPSEIGDADNHEWVYRERAAGKESGKAAFAKWLAQHPLVPCEKRRRAPDGQDELAVAIPAPAAGPESREIPVRGQWQGESFVLSQAGRDGMAVLRLNLSVTGGGQVRQRWAYEENIYVRQLTGSVGACFTPDGKRAALLLTISSAGELSAKIQEQHRLYIVPVKGPTIEIRTPATEIERLGRKTALALERLGLFATSVSTFQASPKRPGQVLVVPAFQQAAQKVASLFSNMPVLMQPDSSPFEMIIETVFPPAAPE